MPHRLRQWVIVGLLALAGVVVLVAASLPYLPLIHGTTAAEVVRLAAWLAVRPGTRVADVGAGDGAFAGALARHVGSSGHVYATELDAQRLADIRRAVTVAKLSNVTVIEGAVSHTNLPDACCDALFSRFVYHHLTDATAINAGPLSSSSSGWPPADHRLRTGRNHQLDQSAGDRGSSRRPWHAEGDRDPGGDGCRLPGDARARVMARSDLRGAVQASLTWMVLSQIVRDDGECLARLGIRQPENGTVRQGQLHGAKKEGYPDSESDHRPDAWVGSVGVYLSVESVQASMISCHRAA